MESLAIGDKVYDKHNHIVRTIVSYEDYVHNGKDTPDFLMLSYAEANRHRFVKQ